MNKAGNELLVDCSLAIAGAIGAMTTIGAAEHIPNPEETAGNLVHYIQTAQGI